jgi:hypothetical protein
VEKGPDFLLGEAFGPFIAALEEDFEKGFAELLKYDSYSVREYLHRVMFSSPPFFNPAFDLKA